MKSLDSLAANSNLELSENELLEVEGGALPIILGAIAIYGGVYWAGHKVGEALYYHNNNKK